MAKVKKQRQKITTIEQLAIAMSKEFSGVYKRFDHVDKEIAALKEEVIAIHLELDAIKMRLGEFAFRFEITDLDRRLRKVEARLGAKG